MLTIGVLVSGRGSNLQAIINNIKGIDCFAIARNDNRGARNDKKGTRNDKDGKLTAKIGCVISDNQDAFALEIAKREGIPAYYIYPGEYKTKLSAESEQKYIECMQKHNVELVCLAGFMRILKSAFISAYKNRIMNIHPALLPSFPGLHAQKQAFDYGVKITGATVHFVTEGIDTGPIIIQRTVEIKEDDTEETLARRILSVEHQIYSEAIQLFADKKLRIEGRKVRIMCNV